MNHFQNTKRSLFSSGLTILLCFSLFIGSTFAWFAFEASNTNNVIQVGNLDIELYRGTGKETVVNNGTVLFEDVTWKPGTVAYENLTVENKGDYSFTYRISFTEGDANYIQIASEAVVQDGGAQTADVRKLKDVLKVAVVDGHITSEDASAVSKEAVLAAVTEWAGIEELSLESSMDVNAEKQIAVVVYWEPAGADSTHDDNEYNSKLHATNDGKPLYINLGMNFQAKQAAVETDDFMKPYDEGASYESGENEEAKNE